MEFLQNCLYPDALSPSHHVIILPFEKYCIQDQVELCCIVFKASSLWIKMWKPGCIPSCTGETELFTLEFELYFIFNTHFRQCRLAWRNSSCWTALYYIILKNAKPVELALPQIGACFKIEHWLHWGIYHCDSFLPVDYKGQYLYSKSRKLNVSDVYV